MKLLITIKPNARHEKIIRHEDGSMELHVKAPPIEGRANKMVIAMLSQHFRVPKSSITLISGAKGRKKLVEILPRTKQ